MAASPETTDAGAAPKASVRRQAARGGRILWICTWTVTLLLAVRWCARTYPGWYFPDSALWNDLLNGVGLFTLYGYDAVFLAAAAALARAFLAGTNRRRASTALGALQWTSLAVVALLVGYGVYWAAGMERLPWQEDGVDRFEETLGLR